MISDELGRLSDWVVGFAATQQPILPDASAHLAHVLLDLSRQAKQLERLPVDDEALHDVE
jgi:hypothetical protein